MKKRGEWFNRRLGSKPQEINTSQTEETTKRLTNCSLQEMTVKGQGEVHLTSINNINNSPSYILSSRKNS